jgi:sulfite exporter TauE/SafE
MSAALVATAAMMGLAGLPHCAGMCGAGCAAAARLCHPARPAGGVAGLLLGRLSAYAAAGALSATLVTGLQLLSEGTGWLRPIWVGLQLFLLVVGLALLLKGRLPQSIEAWVEQFGRRPQDAALTRKVHLPGELKATAIGLLWPVIPCGLLHAALLVAAVASGPLDGALVMLAFGLTSSLGLLLGPAVWLRWMPAALRRSAGQADPGRLALRLAGATISAFAGWGLAHAVMAPIAAWCA